MIYTSLYALASQLSSHLRLVHGLNEEIVELQRLTNNTLSSPPNKMLISLVNIERETAGGMNFHQQVTAGGQYNKTYPEWLLNLYVLFSAVFSEKQYDESLQILSSTLEFLQNNKNYSLPDSSTPLTIEPINLQFSELSNLWSILGGTYYPSIICKIRMLTISNTEIKKLSRPIRQTETNHE